ncbi:hypothetical protein Tco_1445646 [Tanacetum coccineum]
MYHFKRLLCRSYISCAIDLRKDAEIQGRHRHDMEFDFDFNATKEVSTIEKDVSTAELVFNASVAVSSYYMPGLYHYYTTTGYSVKVKRKFKEKGVSSETAIRLTRGVIMKEASETTTRPIVPPQQKLNLKDKGKAKMVEEPPVKIKKKDEIPYDADLAQRLSAQLQAELEEEERQERQREVDANIAE